MFLGRELLRGGLLGKLGFLDKGAMRKPQPTRRSRTLGVGVQDVERAGGNMSGGQRQGVAVARAVHVGQQGRVHGRADRRARRRADRATCSS